MANPVPERRASRLARHAYALQPVRPAFARIGIPVAIGVLAFACGAASMHAWAVHHDRTRDASSMASAQCAAATPPADGVEAELERTRLALAQEKASRAAVQKSADASAAEAGRLDAEVRFLRGETHSSR